MSSTGPIILLTHPRSCSTAFERAIYQLREQVVVMHEPYGQAFYFGKERCTKIPGYLAMQKVDAPSFDEVTATLTRQVGDTALRVFSKDMGYYLHRDGGPATSILRQLADKGATFAFLIRNPVKAVPSLSKMQKQQSVVYGDHLQKEEVGIEELYALYRFLKYDMGLPCTVVDADDVVENPEKILPVFCASVGLTYSEACLRWDADFPTEWENWAGWHEDAKNNVGFVKLAPTIPDTTHNESVSHSDHDRARDVATAIADSTNAYTAMHSDRIVPA